MLTSRLGNGMRLLGIALLAWVSIAFADDPPLRKLFQQIWRKPGETAAEKRDSIDARAPRDAQLEAIWAAAQEAVDRKDWKSAVDRLQSLLELPEDALLSIASGRGESLRQAAQQTLAAAPAPVLADYERQYGGLARQMLDDATRTASSAGLVNVATRYPETNAGREAARQLTARHFDQSEFALAFRDYTSEGKRNGIPQANIAWRLRAAYSAERVGEAAVRRKLLAGLLEQPQPVRIGGRDISSSEWWQRHQRRIASVSQPLQEWWQLGGSAARDGIGPAGTPVLLPTWAAPLTNSDAIRAALDTLLLDLEQNDAVIIPAATPVVVGERIAFRDLRGVRVVDLATGRTLWETAEGISPERILHGAPPEALSEGDAAPFRLQARQMNEEYFGESAEFHPLANWLFRDATSGLISSDGHRLFVLEDVAVLTRNQAGFQWEGEGNPADPFGADWSTNRLTAYDLQTGRVRWTVGGPVSGEALATPLAGAFFLSTPVADAGDLYVIAAQGEELRLQVLDPETGRPRWSQLLAYSDTKIELDLVRRWIGAPVTVGQGIVVCPTASGWLVAVDRLRRQLLWASRYAPRTEGDEQAEPAAQFLPQHELGDAWVVGAPIVQGARVLFAPPDGDALFCLSLVDGRIIWQRPRDDGVSIAALPGDRVLVVGARGLTALSTADGTELWQREFPDGIRPRGRPAVSETQAAIPLSDRQLWLVDLADGRVAAAWRTPANQPPLENLVQLQDRLVSLGAHGCRLFSERTPAIELADQPAGILQQAEMLLLDQKWSEAVSLLTRQDPGTWPEPQREKRWQVLWRAVSEQLEADPASVESTLAHLASSARTDEQRWLVAMRQVDRCLALRQHAKAFEKLWALARQRGPDRVTPVDDAYLSVDRQAWLRGRLHDVWTQSPVEQRTRIDERMQKLIGETLAGTIDDWLALGRWCEFHPFAARISWALAEQWTATRELAKAEATVARWLEHDDRRVAVESRVRLARVWQQLGLAEDAVVLLEGLTDGDWSRRLSTGNTAMEQVHLWKLPRMLMQPVSAESAVRRRWPLHPERTTTTYAAPVQTVMPTEPLPYFQRVFLQIDPQEQRLTVQNRATGQWLWMAPLRTGPQSTDSGSSPIEFLQHRLLVLHRGVLQLVSPIERRLIWTRPLERSAGHGEPMVTARVPQRLIDPLADRFDEYGVTAFHSEWNPISVANENVVVIAGSRTLTAYDPGTGRELWRREGLPPYARVFGSSRLVYVVDGNSNTAQAYRDYDGRPVEIARLRELLTKTLAFRGPDALVLEAERGLSLFNLSTGKTRLRRVDPVTQTARWQITFKAGTHVGLLAPNLAIAVHPQTGGRPAMREVSLIDLDSGQSRSVERFPFGNNGDGFVAFCDAERIYLAVDQGGGGSYHYGDSLAAIDLNGQLVAWDRHTGDKLWQRPVEELNLVFDRFADSPVLILLARNWQMLGNANYTRLHLLLLDKQSGDVLHESDGPSLFSGFHGVDVTAPDGIIELTSYNLRLRFERRQK